MRGARRDAGGVYNEHASSVNDRRKTTIAINVEESDPEIREEVSDPVGSWLALVQSRRGGDALSVAQTLDVRASAARGGLVVGQSEPLVHRENFMMNAESHEPMQLLL